MVKGILPHLFLGDGHRHGCSSVLTKRGYTTPLFYPQRPAFIFLSPIRSKREFPSISNKIGNFHTTKCNKVVRFRTYRPLFSLIAHRRTTRLSKITRFLQNHTLFFKNHPVFALFKISNFRTTSQTCKKGAWCFAPRPFRMKLPLRPQRWPQPARPCAGRRW